MTHVRQAGVERLDQVKRAWVEGNGEISFALKDAEHASGPDARAE